MKKLAEIVCALILFAYPVSAYAEASTEPWSTPLQTTAFIIPGMRYSLLLPPTSPSGPMRVTTSEMSGADAAVVLPR